MSPRELWFRDSAMPAHLDGVREEVRAFLAEQRAAGAFTPRCNSWLEGHDPAFSRRLGERGWLGMTWPARYGGHERSGLERFVVIEELLAVGAPVAAHWIADRQTGPALLKFGTEDQRRRLLPGIARGEIFFAIGMSEPDSGSDLASVRTTAVRVDGGWSISGTKVWTSHAHRSHFFVALCRSSPRTDDRHAGLSQFIVDLQAPGVKISPIRLLNGHAHFAEVVLDGVFVPDGMLLGAEGDGWHQVTAELAHERSGPERILSTYPLLAELVRILDKDEHSPHPLLGELLAELWTLLGMSQAIAGQLAQGTAPNIEAALVKDLGTTLENTVIDVVRASRPPSLESEDFLESLLEQAILGAPGFTLRGGSTEILRGIVAAGLTQ